MANLVATLGMSLQYTDSDGNLVSPGIASIQCPYLDQTVGTIDVPALTAMSTVYSIPFGGVTVAGLIMITNKTSVKLSVKVNSGSSATTEIPVGATYVAQMMTASGTPLVTAITVTLSAAQGASAGLVEYKVLGDAS